MQRKYQTGLVLSGGGARGFAHIGVLKALNEHGIYPEAISAVSAGAIVGALYADGHKPDEIYDLFASLDIYKILRFHRPAFGVLKAHGLKRVFQQHLKHKNLEDLPVALTVSATNFTKARTEFFYEGSIIDAVLASSAIPMILKPYTINGNMYVDGGLMNNLPVEPLENKCEQLIGINVNPVHEVTRFKSFRNYTDRVLHLAIRANVKNNIEKCDIYIEPPDLMDYHLFKISSAKAIFEKGYRHTCRLLRKEM
ncbi:MAG: patatin-like phospholipase family protein [Bacteroidota bacterium]